MPLETVVVAVAFDALTLVFERDWSFPDAAMIAPVNNAPATTLTSMRFVFISLFSILKIRREKQARVSHFFKEIFGIVLASVCDGQLICGQLFVR